MDRRAEIEKNVLIISTVRKINPLIKIFLGTYTGLKTRKIATKTSMKAVKGLISYPEKTIA
jgi:hypothetical protein